MCIWHEASHAPCFLTAMNKRGFMEEQEEMKGHFGPYPLPRGLTQGILLPSQRAKIKTAFDVSAAVRKRNGWPSIMLTLVGPIGAEFASARAQANVFIVENHACGYTCAADDPEPLHAADDGFNLQPMAAQKKPKANADATVRQLQVQVHQQGMVMMMMQQQQQQALLASSLAGGCGGMPLMPGMMPGMMPQMPGMMFASSSGMPQMPSMMPQKFGMPGPSSGAMAPPGLAEKTDDDDDEDSDDWRASAASGKSVWISRMESHCRPRFQSKQPTGFIKNACGRSGVWAAGC